MKNQSVPIQTGSSTKLSKKVSSITQLLRQPSWQTKLVSAFVLSGAIFTFSNMCALAQNITLDGTLAPQETLTGPNYLIPQRAGRTVGNNLFQSFGKFNLDTGEVAKFESSASIRNILARVTGGSLSSINGLIQIQGSNANLFLLNPNGIIFGPNAQLDIRGSFLASTANSFVFQNGSEFSAIHPQPPDLLAINVPIGLQYGGQQPGAIRLEGSLAVDPAKTITLVGGPITIQGQSNPDNPDFRSLKALGGQINLGGVLGAGIVGLNGDGNLLSLNFPENIARSDISLVNSALSVKGNDRGGVEIYARNLQVSSTTIDAGIGAGLGSTASQAGDINLNTTETTTIGPLANIGNSVYFGATGDGGNIKVETGSLFLTDGGSIGTFTDGNGNAGSIKINARNTVIIDGVSLFTFVDPDPDIGLQNIIVFSTVYSYSGEEGRGGNIDITARSLKVSGGGTVESSANRRDGGKITINVNDAVVIDNAGADSTIPVYARGTSSILSYTAWQREGRGGDIDINAGSLLISNGAQLFANKRGQGDGGNVNITTRSLTLSNGGVLSARAEYGQGNAGTISINADDTVSINGIGSENKLSGIFNNILRESEGKAGGINITTGSLFLADGAFLSSRTFGQGDAGNITINARDNVLLTGRIIEGVLRSSAIISEVKQTGNGRGGDISITTGSFFLSEGASIGSATLGQGDAGNITINARDTISLIGRMDIFGQTGNYIASNVETSGTGKGGNLQIATGSLFLSNGTELQALTRGNGDAGNITINARDAVVIDGVGVSGFSSGLFTSAELGALGQGRAITVNTPLLRLSNGGVINARTLNNKPGGNITINADTFEAINGGQVITTTYDSGQAGNIILNVTDKITLSGSDPTYKNRIFQFAQGNPDNTGAASGLYANTTPGSTGNAGSIFIDPRTVLVQDGAIIAVNSQGSGQGGDIDIRAGKLTLDNQSLISAETASNQGGNINFNSNLLLLRRGAQISTNAGTEQQGGDGGNININSKFLVAAPNENSDITANAFNGAGGKIQINATNIFGIAPLSRQDLERLRPLDLDPYQLPSNDITAVSQANPSLSGTIQINTPDADPSRGLVQLSTNVVDVSGQIANGCTPGSRQSQSSFTATGRGGLPISPNQPLQDVSMLSEWVRVTQKPATSNQVQVTPILAKSATQIVEAQGWVVDGNGDIKLVAYSPQVNLRSSWQASVSCPTF
ncbi:MULTISPECIES: two-partner secretion domain-containing protein [Calothrix]|uniref:Filamentous hemagglutinin N-terminal domain-containing protein n=2 Tax=Calothrix TaxID=1186 RepID=A0ABR8A8J2_9CYAN|nr:MULTISPECIES: filamentous hemagglutinin N-terminal domain-containing protein [Calothrix]MBD2195805.1 filamentous hemagglutinin N-terminal domain-containing protein [Calothrix parietina FACHB-288]MBD2226446.1 filamentous hemagglutinin N-terminal domain-containing protein [Calothrix anomala FACHB-343]